jgi:hypothetical protein
MMSSFQILPRTRTRGEHFIVRWAIPQLHDIDTLSKMVDPALNGEYSAKSLSNFADIISRCVQVRIILLVSLWFPQTWYIINMWMPPSCSPRFCFLPNIGWLPLPNLKVTMQSEPEFRPQMSEVVQDLTDMIRRDRPSNESIGDWMKNQYIELMIPLWNVKLQSCNLPECQH